MCENCEMMAAEIEKSVQNINEAMHLVNRYDNSIKQAMGIIYRYEQLVVDLKIIIDTYKIALANKSIADLKRIIHNECPN